MYKIYRLPLQGGGVRGGHISYTPKQTFPTAEEEEEENGGWRWRSTKGLLLGAAPAQQEGLVPGAHWSHHVSLCRLHVPTHVHLIQRGSPGKLYSCLATPLSLFSVCNTVCLCAQVFGGNNPDDIRREASYIAAGFVGLAVGAAIVYFSSVRVATHLTNTHTHIKSACMDDNFHLPFPPLIRSLPPPSPLPPSPFRASLCQWQERD